MLKRPYNHFDGCLEGDFVKSKKIKLSPNNLVFESDWVTKQNDLPENISINSNSEMNKLMLEQNKKLDSLNLRIAELNYKIDLRFNEILSCLGELNTTKKNNNNNYNPEISPWMPYIN